jgi:hypothetical protein
LIKEMVRVHGEPRRGVGVQKFCSEQDIVDACFIFRVMVKKGNFARHRLRRREEGIGLAPLDVRSVACRRRGLGEFLPLPGSVGVMQSRIHIAEENEMSIQLTVVS